VIESSHGRVEMQEAFRFNPIAVWLKWPGGHAATAHSNFSEDAT